MADRVLAEKDFVVGAPRERVWRLIGKVIFSVLPGMENLEILDENNFRALLRTRFSGIPVTLKMKGEILNLEPPDAFSVKLVLEGPGGFFTAGQKVSFSMTPAGEGKTAVGCRASVEEMGLLPRILILGGARRFARATFAAIEKRLRELA